MTMTPIQITYSHAVKNPWDNSIPKPYERREVSLLAGAEYDHHEQEYSVRIEQDGKTLATGYAPNFEKAMDDAIFHAQLALMDVSRIPWN